MTIGADIHKACFQVVWQRVIPPPKYYPGTENTIIRRQDPEQVKADHLSAGFSNILSKLAFFMHHRPKAIFETICLPIGNNKAGFSSIKIGYSLFEACISFIGKYVS
jgi:hypothetical protein